MNNERRVSTDTFHHLTGIPAFAARALGSIALLGIFVGVQACGGSDRDASAEGAAVSAEAIHTCPVGQSWQCDVGLGGRPVCGCQVDVPPPPPPPPPPPYLRASEVAALATAACVLASDATVRCWGGNYLGATVPIFRNVRHIAGGTWSNAMCAIHTDGTLDCVDPAGGAVAISTAADPALVGVTDVAVDGYMACALLGNNSVRCWGLAASTTGGGPGTVAGGPGHSGLAATVGASAIAVAGTSFCVVGAGNVYCRGTDQAQFNSPGLVQVPGVSGASFISGTGQEFCANGPVYTDCFGSARYRSPLVGVKRVSIGAYTYAIDAARGLEFWSDSRISSPWVQASAPQPYAALSNIANISSGSSQACAIDTQGVASCWADPRSAPSPVILR